MRQEGESRKLISTSRVEEPSFWGPFCCWLILGVLAKQDGWSMPPIAWAAAVVMVVGIFIIAMNPLDLLKKKSGV